MCYGGETLRAGGWQSEDEQRNSLSTSAALRQRSVNRTVYWSTDYPLRKLRRHLPVYLLTFENTYVS